MEYLDLMNLASFLCAGFRCQMISYNIWDGHGHFQSLFSREVPTHGSQSCPEYTKLEADPLLHHLNIFFA